jgi:hypothetical protein
MAEVGTASRALIKDWTDRRSVKKDPEDGAIHQKKIRDNQPEVDVERARLPSPFQPHWGWPERQRRQRALTKSSPPSGSLLSKCAHQRKRSSNFF